jgi:hypothetical protein
MGWSYRKRLKFGPIRINLSRSGVGMSWGIRGFRITHSATGRRYMTLSLPGTGLSWQKTLGGSRRRTALRKSTVPMPPPTAQATHPPPVPPVPPTQPATAGTSAPPLVNGMPWWKQTGISKGP